MRQVVPPINVIRKILREQKAESETSYRLTTHCIWVEQPEAVLLYHTLTGEVLLLSRQEAALLKKFPGSVPPALTELISRWFLRPLEADDMALADQTREIVELLGKKETALTTYTILTTTDCNARCFYCFEAGWQKSSMTEQTARDTAAFIASHCNGRPVHLEWYGGEPLVNARAIDVITDCLRQAGAAFHSTMISNGYLFDEAVARHAWDVWNLKQVQITLDGTEEVYNQRKAYINPQGSPFQRVLRNIGLLLDAGIRVSVRLNIDRDNEDDLYSLVDELAERFAGKPGFGIYSMVIYENEGVRQPHYTDEERLFYVQMRHALHAYAESKGIMARPSLKRGFSVTACVADNASYTTVTPVGQLGRCSSGNDSAIWGSIYSDEVDEEVRRQWKVRRVPEEVCKTCSVYPQCLCLEKCPRTAEHCTHIEQSIRENQLRRAVLGAYKDWKTAGQT